MKQSCAQIYYGDGKGKTTAAMGLAVRARGAGCRVLVTQFLQGQETSELEPLRQKGHRYVRLELVDTHRAAAYTNPYYL